jgi:UPF0755 protein
MTLNKKSKLLLFPKVGKFIIVFFTVALLIVGLRAYQLYNYIFKDNVKNEYILIIPEGAGFEQVLDSLEANDVLINYKAFKWVSKKKNYPEAVKPGRYIIREDLNTNQLVNILRGGIQEPVNVIFNNVRFKEELAGKISGYIEADSASILELFSDTDKIEKLGFNPETFKAMFIPNTYEFYWTTTAEEFAERMKQEFDEFWNEERKSRAKAIGLTPVEVTTLASIVAEETARADELKRVAGLYVNRLKRGIPLQADPTVRFAMGDFSVNRILNSHLETDSPYNTYKNPGLPPGPINFPEIAAIDAVLYHEDHNFIFMCARGDFSGYHNFSTTLTEHNLNANKYRQALDENKIWK